MQDFMFKCSKLASNFKKKYYLMVKKNFDDFSVVNVSALKSPKRYGKNKKKIMDMIFLS